MLRGPARISISSSRSLRRRFSSLRLFRAIFRVRLKSIRPTRSVILIFNFQIQSLEQAAKGHSLIADCEEGRRDFFLAKTITANRPTLRQNSLIPLQTIETVE